MSAKEKENKGAGHSVSVKGVSGKGHARTQMKTIRSGSGALGNKSFSSGHYTGRDASTGRFLDFPVSHDSKGNPEGYIIKFDEFEELQDRLDILEVNDRLRGGGGIPHDVVKLELSGLSPLAAWRKYRGLTQAALADAANITQPYIAAIESGKKDGKATTLKALADVLGTTIDNLIE